MRNSRLGFARANSLRPVPILQLLLAGTLAFGVGTFGHGWYRTENTVDAVAAAVPAALQETIQNAANLASVQSLSDARASLSAAVNPKPENVTREAELDEDQTFADLLPRKAPRRPMPWRR